MASDDLVTRRESGLQRSLSERQLAMIAIGGAIGTGLFLGSTLAISLAGPSVIVSYIFGAIIALIMIWALTEMSVVHPTAGSFGVYAEEYLNPYSGFLVRWTYWLAQVIAIGGEVTAAGIYTQYWLPQVPLWYFVIAYSAILIGVNASNVKAFGEFEYWFAMIKVVVIALFIVLGLGAIIFGYGGHPAVGLQAWTTHGGFFPHGVWGTWLAMLIVIFSFYGVEVVSVTSGEAKNPERSLPRAMRSMVLRLTLFYVLAIAIVVAVVPWTQAGLHGGVATSPFVLVFHDAGIPAAAAAMNFVVLTAALSSMNTNLYLTTRMMFSLSRSRFAPAAFGKVGQNGAPRNALLLSTVGLILAAILSVAYADTAYFYLFGISIFGGILVWMFVLATLLAFRKKRERLGLPPSPIRMTFYPWSAIFGLVVLFGILLTAFPDGLPIAWEAGVPYIVVISIIYFFVRKRHGLPVAKGPPPEVKN